MSKRLVGDVFFLAQLGFASTFGISQFIQLLSSSQGVSMSWFGAWEVFLLLNLWLAWRAHEAQPSRVTKQTLVSYLVWCVMIGLDLSVLFLRETWTWNERDTLTLWLTGAGVLVTLTAGRFDIKNPLVKGWLAVFFKAVPQAVLAWNILLVGGDGLAWLAIVAGHATILSRIGQLALSMREAGWDKNRIASFISEVANELSWVLATAAWLIAR